MKRKILTLMIITLIFIFPLKVVASDSQIKSLAIKNYLLNFQKDNYNYELKMNYFESKLDFVIETSSPYATYQILNNHNLKNNSQVLIKVTSNQNAVTTYTLTIKKEFPIIPISLFIFLILSALAVIIYLKKRRNINYTYRVV